MIKVGIDAFETEKKQGKALIVYNKQHDTRKKKTIIHISNVKKSKFFSDMFQDNIALAAVASFACFFFLFGLNTGNIGSDRKNSRYNVECGL